MNNNGATLAQFCVIPTPRDAGWVSRVYLKRHLETQRKTVVSEVVKRHVRRVEGGIIDPVVIRLNLRKVALDVVIDSSGEHFGVEGQGA